MDKNFDFCAGKISFKIKFENYDFKSNMALWNCQEVSTTSIKPLGVNLLIMQTFHIISGMLVVAYQYLPCGKILRTFLPGRYFSIRCTCIVIVNFKWSVFHSEANEV